MIAGLAEGPQPGRPRGGRAQANEARSQWLLSEAHVGAGAQTGRRVVVPSCWLFASFSSIIGLVGTKTMCFTQQVQTLLGVQIQSAMQIQGQHLLQENKYYHLNLFVII